MVVWEATKSGFDEAATLAKAGHFRGRMDDFARMAGLNQLDDVTRGDALALAVAKDYDGARRMYQSTMVKETLFPYLRAMNPTLYRTAFGKMFGAFGSYSFWWADNIRKGLSRGSFGDKLGYATRFLGNGAILTGAAAAAGINGSAFTPWGPLAFSGSPYYQLITLAVAANPASNNYRARQAQAELVGWKYKNGKVDFSLQNFAKSQAGTWLAPIPGRFAVRGLTRAAKYINDGDPYRALLAGIGAPQLY